MNDTTYIKYRNVCIIKQKTYNAGVEKLKLVDAMVMLLIVVPREGKNKMINIIIQYTISQGEWNGQTQTKENGDKKD